MQSLASARLGRRTAQSSGSGSGAPSRPLATLSTRRSSGGSRRRGHSSRNAAARRRGPAAGPGTARSTRTVAGAPRAGGRDPPAADRPAAAGGPRMGEEGREPRVEVAVERRARAGGRAGAAGGPAPRSARPGPAAPRPCRGAAAGAGGGRRGGPPAAASSSRRLAAERRGRRRRARLGRASSSTAAAGKLGQLAGSPTSRCQSRPTFSSYSRNSSDKAAAQPRLARTSSRRPCLTSASSESGSIMAASSAAAGVEAGLDQARRSRRAAGSRPPPRGRRP